MSKKESVDTRSAKSASGGKARNFSIVGTSVNKIDALSLSTGRAQFTDDFSIPNTAHIKLLYSPHAHAKIKMLDISETLKVHGVIDIIHHGNVPEIFHTTAGQGYPEPSPYDTLMFDSTMRFVGDRVAAVLAETPEIAEEALSKIKVEYEILPALLDFEKAMDDDAPKLHLEKGKGYLIGAPYFPEKNIAAKILIDVGNLEQGLSESDLTFSETFYTHYGSHAALEPNAVLSYFDERNRLVIVTSTQVPFHARRICSHLLQIPIRQIHVIKPRIGGGFGGKQEVFLEYIAGMFTLRTGRPAKIVLTREEVFISSRTRHPMRVNVQAGVQKDGTIHAIAINALMNTGAYGAHALTVLSNAGSKVLPLVNKAPHQRFNGITVYTNLPVAGAYRGYGATQGYFPLGQMMDIMARKLDIDVLDLYRKNAIRKGETSPIFQKLGEGKEGVEQFIESCGLDECIERGAHEIRWKEKRDKKIRNGAKVRGVGMACMMQGSAIPRVDMGAAYIKMNEDGSFNLQIGATDIGTGSDTILGQIAAEALSVGIDDIIVASSDTDFTPFDVGAYASSTTYLSGEAVRKCAEKVKMQILDVAAEMSHSPVESLAMKEKKVMFPGGELSFQEICHYAMYAVNQFQIQASASHFTTASPPPFAAHFAEVEIDTETGDIRVVKYVSVTDCGQPINPKLVEGQIEGAIVNGISWVLTEEYLFNEKGKMTNPNFGRYKLFSAADLPDIKTIVVQTYEPTGPYGAKSVAEIGINGPAPAIANAIFDAIGVRIHALPLTAEKIFQALKTAKK
ncbi:MAG: aldehyde oxidase [Candidatus Marinimicrobia bacterium CG08_land_8_20_14_0_20_45_22]|nr:MAG: aldehyde oxidase [Candidatus Marinimicrobia bacterium CG08_land_8_20_14_0_20_45_22]